MSQRVLYLIVCAAGPAPQVGKLVSQAQQRGWVVRIISTPAALSFIDVPALEDQTKIPIRSQPRAPGTPRFSMKADALIIAPATFNTINKLAAGISDNYALDVINEMISLVPVVMLPFVNSSLANRPQFVRSIQSLRNEGIFSTWEYTPHPPGKGGEIIDAFPWDKALDQVERLTSKQTNDRSRSTQNVSWPSQPILLLGAVAAVSLLFIYHTKSPSF